MLNNKNI